MHVVFNLPDVPIDNKALGMMWLRGFFGDGSARNPEVRSLARAFVRLVHAAARAYIRGVAHTKRYWETHDSFAVGDAEEAVSQFEHCISNTHRAINFFDALRRHKFLENLDVINDLKPTFLRAMRTQISDIRNEVQHLEAAILNGEILEGRSTALHATGLEVPAPDEPGQTIMTIDRLVIGQYEIKAADLALCLTRLLAYCRSIAEAPPVPPADVGTTQNPAS